MEVARIKITIHKSAVTTFGVLTLGLLGILSLISWLTGTAPQRSLIDLALVALGGAGFHFVAQFVHLLGHALAAWTTGYPTTGMVFLYGFAMSQYPPDEPLLADRVHIQRSLGGVVAFGLLLGFVLLLWLNARTGPHWWARALTTAMLVDVSVLFLVSAVLSDGVLFVVRKGWRPAPDAAKGRVRGQ